MSYTHHIIWNFKLEKWKHTEHSTFLYILLTNLDNWYAADSTGLFKAKACKTQRFYYWWWIYQEDRFIWFLFIIEVAGENVHYYMFILIQFTAFVWCNHSWLFTRYYYEIQTRRTKSVGHLAYIGQITDI
jgi:hypothetical protein